MVTSLCFLQGAVFWRLSGCGPLARSAPKRHAARFWARPAVPFGFSGLASLRTGPLLALCRFNKGC